MVDGSQRHRAAGGRDGITCGSSLGKVIASFRNLLKDDVSDLCQVFIGICRHRLQRRNLIESVVPVRVPPRLVFFIITEISVHIRSCRNGSSKTTAHGCKCCVKAWSYLCRCSNGAARACLGTRSTEAPGLSRIGLTEVRDKRLLVRLFNGRLRRVTTIVQVVGTTGKCATENDGGHT